VLGANLSARRESSPARRRQQNRIPLTWQRRTEIIAGVPFTSLEPVPTSGGPVDWNGGCVQLPPPAPRVEWTQDEGGWQTAMIEDGASLIFGALGE
jgi:hypothetical protein